MGGEKYEREIERKGFMYHMYIHIAFPKQHT